MWGTIPQWIGAAALIVIALIEVTQWPGFTPEWVSAIATAVLALTAIVGLFGVFLPRQLEHARHRSLHLEEIITIVLEPIRQQVENCEQLVLRTGYPLRCWVGKGLESNWPLCPPTSRLEPMAGGPDKQDTSLYHAHYTDVEQNHYPQLLTAHERFDEECQAFVASDLLPFAKDLEQRLREGLSLPDLEKEDVGQRGCFYANLALYVFNRIWITNYPSSLFEQPDGLGQGHQKLRSNSSGQEYAWDVTPEETALLKDRAEALVIDNEITKRANVLKSRAEELEGKRQGLLASIADIRSIGKLSGDCKATR